jgi:ubiquinone/menaquinone biosynthesis C-methylase UbiE
LPEAQDATVRFGDRAGAYAQFRPGYDDAVIDAVLDGFERPVVADVGAGTGISSLALARRGARVIAIEPNDAMRAKAPAHSAVEWRAGTAYATGLEAKSIDIAVCFQAFHWFADEAALKELTRIARRRVAIVQYERDETDAFSRAYGDVVRAYATDDTEQRRLHALEFFERWSGEPPHVFASAQQLTKDQLTGRAQSSSYLPKNGPAADALHKEIAQLFERYQRLGIVTLVNATYVLMRDLG